MKNKSFTEILTYLYMILAGGFVISILGFLTYDNMRNGQAIYGVSRGNDAIEASGYPAILINIGIVVLILSALSYFVYIFTKRKKFEGMYISFGVLSGLLVISGAILRNV